MSAYSSTRRSSGIISILLFSNIILFIFKKAYFKFKGLDINKTDLKGSTPLHWASYLGCENAVNFLVSWKPKFDLKDEEGGLTPLHLAVISGNSRVVRKLLIKGSDRSIRDKNNKTPADLAKDNDYNNIFSMLVNFLFEFIHYFLLGRK